MALTSQMRRQLKSRAHNLHPIIIIGSKGLTDAVITETDSALSIHELIKIRVNAIDSIERKWMIENLCEQTNADCVGTIGHVAILYRQNEE